MSRFDALFSDHLEALSTRRLLRTLRPLEPGAPGRLIRDGRSLLNVSSNDYLGLSRHPALIARARQWLERWGAGATASRLVSGSLEACHRLESRLARFKGTEAALILASGWQANASVLPALFDAGMLGAEPLVFTDRLIHASLHQGCQAASVRQIRFRHNDPGHLESLLIAHANRPGRRFIVTESVFSMDGDRADLAALAGLAERHDAFLYVDEAHATGVLGPGGAGLSATVAGRIDLVMGTFGKALGGFGAYVAGSRVLCELLVNRCSGFVYATALPPAVLGAIDAALDLVPAMEAERSHLETQANRLRAALQGAGIATGTSSTQIVPALIGDEGAALEASHALLAAGILGIAIRPPTVPAGSARIRFALSAVHSAADIDTLIAAAIPILRPVPQGALT
ncbi:MAG: aminotransferase class I/II-fold pyridoxal phosphate-dependent enzyme [Rhodospirillaceae bacterium]